MTGEEPHSEGGLLREIARELDQVAHFGKAHDVKDLVARAAVALDEGSNEEAVDLLGEAKPKAPRSPSVRELLGLAYYGLGRWREAAREFGAYRRLSDRHNRDPEYADCYRAAGRPERAVEVLSELDVAALPEEVAAEALIVHAGALVDLGRHEEAVRLLEGGPVRPGEVLPYHLRLWYALADALEGAGRRAEARDWWDALYAEDPEFFDVAERRVGVKRRGD